VRAARGSTSTNRERHRRASVVLWHEHELSLRRGAFEHLVRAASLGERQALGHDRVDLVLTEQLEQSEEILPEPFRVAGTPPRGPPNSPRTLLAVRMKKSPMPNDRDVNPFDASRHRSELRRVVRQIQALTLEPDTPELDTGSACSNSFAGDGRLSPDRPQPMTRAPPREHRRPQAPYGPAGRPRSWLSVRHSLKPDSDNVCAIGLFQCQP
jgi:hypothetical protein